MSTETAISAGRTATGLTSKVKCEALAGRVYEAIKEAILDLKLAPGSRINMDQLARDLGVSISPIREALIRLTAERLVVFKSYAGYAVTPIPDKQSILDLVDARLLIESQAARLGAPRREPAILATMHQAMEEISHLCFGSKYREYRSLTESDARLHGAIIASSGNSVFVRIYEDLHPHTQISRLYIHGQREIDPAIILQGHVPILRAYEQGDADAAVEAIRVHMEVTREWVSKLER
jgi:DNA-binding GntR family transcriptional regulator